MSRTTYKIEHRDDPAYWTPYNNNPAWMVTKSPPAIAVTGPFDPTKKHQLIVTGSAVNYNQQAQNLDVRIRIHGPQQTGSYQRDLTIGPVNGGGNRAYFPSLTIELDPTWSIQGLYIIKVEAINDTYFDSGDVWQIDYMEDNS